MAITALILLAAGQLAHAHFAIEYPAPRGITIGAGRNESYSQWENPCEPLPLSPPATVFS